MARIQVLQPHGTTKRYRQGCRCDACRAANAEYQRNFQLGLSSPKSVAADNVTSINGHNGSTKPKRAQPKRDASGEVEKAVKAQLADFTAEFPTQVEMAVVCARILDNDERVALHPTTVRQLAQIVESLTAGKKKKSRGRLAAVQSMTARRSVNG